MEHVRQLDLMRHIYPHKSPEEREKERERAKAADSDWAKKRALVATHLGSDLCWPFPEA